MGDVRQPGNLEPGLEGVQEKATASVTISGSDTSGTLSFSLDGAYDATPDLVGISFELTNASGSSSASFVTGYVENSPGSDTYTVDVHLDTAPGSGEQVDVEAAAWFDGDPA